MIFASDNWAGASDRVMARLAEEAKRGGPAYGSDPLSRAVEERFAEIFERDVAVFFVATGTAANALALSAYAKPGSVVFCHREAHILEDEPGSTELFSNGARLLGLDGRAGKIAADTLAAALARFPVGNIHHGRPGALSLTQITELGACYSPDEIAVLAGMTHARDAMVHMDGARFAVAVAALGVAPADITWRAGVDVLSFGATKNGCLAAEAVVFFNAAEAAEFAFIRQRAGHQYSKAWFVAAQFAAYFGDGHWLELARHANAMGARLAEAVRLSASARLAVEPDANEIFVILPKSEDDRLRAAGAVYHPWSVESFPAGERPRQAETLIRLVTTFRTTAEEIDRFADLIK